MNEHRIKPPTATAPEAAPVTFPMTNLQFGPLGGGFVIQVLLANDLVITKMFSGADEEQICNLLIQRRKEHKQQELEQLAVIKQVNMSKNN